MSREQLASNGGPKTATEGFPPWPWFPEETIQAVLEPLRTGKVNYWTGPLGMQFEQEFADWCGAKYGISTSSGTSALHVGLAALNIGPGDEVICPSYTFIASSFAICQAGAVPVFADVDRSTHTISPASIEKKLSERTRAILPVHLYGCICDMAPILDIARAHDLVVIEDCAQAHGGEYEGKLVGTLGDVGCFSFCQSKHFTTGGEGGCVITDDEDVAWHCRSFRDHGYDVEQRLSLLELEAVLPYIHNMLGFNYRLTEMQSALGLKELARMDTWHLPRRRANAELLEARLADCPQILHLPIDTDERRNAYWLFPIIMELDSLDCDIRVFVEALGAEGIPCGPVLWPQCYKENAYQEHKGFGRLKYPFESPDTRPEAVQYDQVYCENADWVEQRCFWVPVHPTYEAEHLELIAAGILKVAAAYAK